MVNPNFFYDYAKMFGERTRKDSDNYVERMLNSDDTRLKQLTYNQDVLSQLEQEMDKFLRLQRGKKYIQAPKAEFMKIKHGKPSQEEA